MIQVLHSGDGGKTWASVLNTGIPMNGPLMTPWPFAEAFPSREVGLVAGPAPSGGVLVMETTDGGRNWNRAVIQTRLTNSAVASIPTPSRAYLLCLSSPGAGQMTKALYVSTDQGRDWSLVASPSRFPIRAFVTGMAFSDASPGWIAGTPTGSSTWWLLQTSDGGANWSASNLPGLPASGGAGYTYAPVWSTGGTGWLVAEQDASQVIHVYTSSKGGGLIPPLAAEVHG